VRENPADSRWLISQVRDGTGRGTACKQGVNRSTGRVSGSNDGQVWQA
jgi:hypothetical protein